MTLCISLLYIADLQTWKWERNGDTIDTENPQRSEILLSWLRWCSVAKLPSSTHPAVSECRQSNLARNSPDKVDNYMKLFGCSRRSIGARVWRQFLGWMTAIWSKLNPCLCKGTGKHDCSCMTFLCGQLNTGQTVNLTCWLQCGENSQQQHLTKIRTDRQEQERETFQILHNNTSINLSLPIRLTGVFLNKKSWHVSLPLPPLLSWFSLLHLSQSFLCSL